MHQWNQSITLSGSGGYRVRSFWANASDGTTQLCIIRVMWTNWVPLGLEVLPSESASKTEQWIHRRRINVILKTTNSAIGNEFMSHQAAQVEWRFQTFSRYACFCQQKYILIIS